MLVDFNDEILIPDDVENFAVVACDQFSANPEYWRALEKELSPETSALGLILPECFLHETDARLAEIKRNAAIMSENGLFKPVRGAVAVTRTTVYGRERRGIVASVDLDEYDYKPNNAALIRASERTIEERIPPRVRIRRAIDWELPHILLLVDDRERLLEKAVDSARKTTLYDCDLKGGGGHIKGELIDDCDGLCTAADGIIAAAADRFGTRLFALVGDGNHSLATAKYCREHFPTASNGRALVEIINVYDDGLVFEPIHRLVKVDDPVMFTDSFKAAIKGDATTELYAGDACVTVNVPSDKIAAINAVDKFCETFVKHFGGSIEYVHGESALKQAGSVGIRVRGIEKSELFAYVLKNGVLPKKTFSLGEAEEKRFYIEARKIN